MSPTLGVAVKFDEIARDYDYDRADYERELDRQYSRSLALYSTQPEEEEEIVYRRKPHRSFARQLANWLIDSGGLSLECREALECLEDSIGSGKGRVSVYFPESIFRWLEGQRAAIEAYLNGKYADELDRFFGGLER